MGFGKMENLKKYLLTKIAISKETKRNDEECRHLYDLALNGLKLLSKWTNTVLELVREGGNM